MSKKEKTLKAKDLPRDMKRLDDSSKKSLEVYHLGDIVDVDPENYTFTFKMAFLSPEDFDKLVALKGEIVKLLVSPNQRLLDKPSLKQHRKFFVSVRCILKHKARQDAGIQVNERTMRLLYNEIRHDYFPVREYAFGSTPLYHVPSIKNLTKEELAEVLDLLISDYSIQGVNFDEYYRES